METPARIRHERPADRLAIARVNERAFGGASEAALVDALRARGAAVVSLVAELDGQITGHILFSPVDVEGARERGSAVGLGPMAVDPPHQRRGIGSALVRRGLDACRRAGHAAVVVLGHPSYYPRFGFAPARDLGLRCEFEVPDEAFMALELRAGSLAGARGMVRYRPEFSAMTP